MHFQQLRVFPAYEEEITRRRKTNTESNIRLLDVPKRIIEKSKWLSKDGHVFPVPGTVDAMSY